MPEHWHLEVCTERLSIALARACSKKWALQPKTDHADHGVGHLGGHGRDTRVPEASAGVKRDSMLSEFAVYL